MHLSIDSTSENYPLKKQRILNDGNRRGSQPRGKEVLRIVIIGNVRRCILPNFNNYLFKSKR